MLNLYSATLLICQRETKEVALKDKPNSKIIIKNLGDNFEIRGIDPHTTQAEKLGLGNIIDLILKRFPYVKMIVHLGTHQNPLTFFLLILIDDNERTSEGEISNKIEDHCKFLANVHTPVRKSISAKIGLETSNRWNRAWSILV
jgi:hypothetical protein